MARTVQKNPTNTKKKPPTTNKQNTKPKPEVG